MNETTTASSPHHVKRSEIFDYQTYEESRADTKNKIFEIEKLGGAMKAIEAGFQQKEIHESAWSHLTQVESGDRKIVGLNHGVLDDEEMPPLLRPDPDLGLKQKEKLAKLRIERDESKVQSSLEKIRTASEGTENLFPIVIEALRNDCTLGEIIGAMKDVFGTWMAPSGF